jgi:WD40 repeat protein/serine/threonine protein kinase
MSPDTLFAQAIEIASARERTAFLEEACGSDLQLRRELEKLVRDHFRAGDFLERPAAHVAATVDELSGREGPGTVIGPYTLREQIGEGGMGLVFVAEQQQPVRRKVALKVIKPGMDTRQVVARFEAERQALALMDHPNIARVFDGGETAGGRPYFVMELVKGVPITQFCDDNRLATRQRLELFVSVCQAVQHAHQKGVIHRDLKPSNVLVTSHDGTPVAKVIDFGIAKAVGQSLTDKTVYTQFSQLVGTPLYMSPEQAGLSGLDVDTRSDVYSLGVLLYEMLTGATPFDAKRLEQVGFDELRRIIREEEPPRPSTRVGTLGPAAATASVNRKSDPVSLSRLLRGDLDWVVGKALEKDRSRRYETANDFAQDVRRYLADEPVQAGPPGAGYRLRKFVKRHRGPVLAAAVVLLALVAGIGGTTAGLVEARQQRDRADDARTDAEKNAEKERAARDRAETQLLRAEWLLYGSRINLAQQAWEGNDPALAFHYLDSCRPDFRGWEHDYLFTLFTSGRRTFRGHTRGVTGVAVSPDGRHVVSGSWDKTVRVWDLATGQSTLTLRGNKGEFYCVAVSPDGKRIFGGCHFGAVLVWDAATGQEIQTLQGHEQPISAVTLPPDGKRVVGSSWDGLVRVWDADTGRTILRLRGGRRAACVAVSPDGRRIAGDSPGGLVKVWDTDTGQEILTLRGHEGAVGGVAFSPDGRRIASASVDMTVRVWDADTGKEVLTLRGHTDTVNGVAFSRDGRRLVSCSVDRQVKVWDAVTGREVRALRGHEQSIESVALSPDGRHIVSGSFDHTVKVWDMAPGQERLPRWDRYYLTCLALSRDGKRFIGSGGHLDINGASTQVTIWDEARGYEPLTLRGHTSGVTCLDVSPDGRRVVSGSFDETVKVWDTDKRQEPLTLRGHTLGVDKLALSPDGRRVVSISDQGKSVKVWDADTGEEPVTLRGITGGIFCAAFSPDGRRIVGGGGEHTVKVWDADTGQEVQTLRGHEGNVYSVAVSPDGRRIVSGSDDRTVKVWDADTGQNTLTLRGHTREVLHVAVSPDGRRIASAGIDRAMKLWDAATGYETLSLKAQTNLSGQTFSPDGKRIFCVGDGNVKVWDAGKSQQNPDSGSGTADSGAPVPVP